MGYHISNENEKINENMDTFYKQNVDQKKQTQKHTYVQYGFTCRNFKNGDN